MSLDERAKSETGHGFPRVSGDEPTALETAGARRVFSPRERG